MITEQRTDLDHPSTFKGGVRVLLLMLRAKDGGSAKTDRKATKKVVTQNAAEFDEALAELRTIWQPGQRIYASINARDLGKAQRIFNFHLLEANYFDPASRDAFYLDLENRWISCLKSPRAATQSLFLFDVDEEDHLHELRDHKLLQNVGYWYPTRNGWHFITPPFNPGTLPTHLQPLLMKDSLMLWSF